jgi:lysophospholipase L1-like esterase
VSSPGPRFARYVALGDSTTEGLNDPLGADAFRGWSHRLAEHLVDGGHPLAYANLAVRGLTAPAIRATQLAPALAMAPDLCTVVAGVNDLLRPRFDAEVVGAEVRAMIAALRARGATVLTFTMPDMVRVNPWARLIRGRLRRLNEQLRRTCLETGALLLDLESNPVAQDPRLWDEDRLHANALGHQRIAAALAHTLGLPGFAEALEALPPAPPAGLRARLAAEWRWTRGHFAPWAARRLAGGSSSAGRRPKRPDLRPLP